MHKEGEKVKRLLAVFMASVMLFVGISFVFADEQMIETVVLSENEQDKLTLLYKMGITDSAQITSDSVTRGEFAVWLSKLSGIEIGVVSANDKFTDVPKTSAYASAVAIVSSMGAMNGVSETEFGVNVKISRTDALVAIVRMLGYEHVAKVKGGYPGGYISCASGFGISRYTNNENDRVAILLMCYNALSVTCVESDGRWDEGNILLEYIHGIEKIKGNITGNRFTCIGKEDSGLDSNEIMIDDVKYITEDVSYADYLGEYVLCYYYYDEREQERHIVHIKPLENRYEKLILEDDKILFAENNSITYESEDGNIEKVKLRAGFDYVLNNVTVAKRQTADLKLADGELTLIDYEGDGVFDLAKAKSRETMVYQGADNLEDLIYCREGTIYTDPFDESYYFRIILVDSLDGSEKDITIDELSSGDVLTVYRSKDDKYTLIYAYSQGVYGFIDSYSDDEVVIDGISYELPLKTPVSDLTIGAKVAFSTDMFGRLVYMEEENIATGPFYGYFFSYNPPKALANGKVKIIDGKEIKVLTCADDVTIDDSYTVKGSEFNKCHELFEGDTAKRQLIRYSLDKDGNIKAVYTAFGSGKYSIKKQPGIEKGSKTKYYQWHNIWAGQYVLPDENFYLVIPNVGDEAENPELYGTQYQFGTDINDVYVEIFDVDDDMEIGALLLYSDKALDGLSETNSDTSSGIFIKEMLGEEGPIAYIFTRNGETKAFNVKSENYKNLNEFAFGDVVRYVVAADGKVSTLTKVLDVGTTAELTPPPIVNKDDLTISQDGYNYHYFARIYKKLDDYMVLVPNLNGGIANPAFDSASEKRVVIPNNIQSCYLVDMGSERVVSGSLDAMSQYFEDSKNGGCYVYVKVYKWTSVTEMYIYKF